MGPRAVMRQKVLHIVRVCVFCIIYQTCKSHVFCAVLYCHLRPVLAVPCFFLYDLINGTIFEKKKKIELHYTKCVF